MKVGDLFAVLHLNKKGFTAGLAAAKGEAGGLGSVIKKVALGMGVAIAAVGGIALKMAADFQAGMANVQTLIGRGSEADARIVEMGDALKHMSTESGSSLEDLTGGLYQVVSALGDTADTMEILEIADRAAVAGLSTTTDAINLLSAVTKSYGDTSAGAFRKASDLAFQTVVLGQTTFPELASSMGRAIPIAAALGVEQEELFAVMATLTGVTGSTDQVTTQLRGSMSALLKPSINAKKALAELGFAGATAGTDIVAEKGLVGALRAVAETSVASDVGVAKLFTNVNTLNAVLALTGAQATVFDEKLGQMSDAVGVADEAFEIQQATVERTMARVSAALGVVMVDLGERLLPVAQMVLEWIIKNWPAIAGTFDAVATVIGTTIGVIVTAVSALIKVIDFLKPAIIGVAVVIGAVMLPALMSMIAGAVATGAAMAVAFAVPAAVVLALVATLAAASAAINFFAMDFGEMGDRIHDISDRAGEDFNDVKEYIRDYMSSTGASFEEASAKAEEHFGLVDATASDMAAGTRDSWETYQAAAGRAAEETGVRTGEITGDVAAMDADTEQLLQEMGVNTDELEGDFGDLATNIGVETDAATEHVESFLDRTVRAIQEAEDPIRSGGEAAADAWLDPIKTATEISALESELASKEMRDNLRSEDPNIVRDAQLRTATIRAELIKLKNEQALQGDATAQIAKSKSLLTSQFMEEGLASKDEEIQATFRAWKSDLQARIAEMESAARGARIAEELRGNILSKIPSISAAAIEAAQAVRAVFPSSEPKDSRSPFRGITEGWHIGEVMSEGFGRSMRATDFAGLFRGSMTPVAATVAPGGSASRGEHESSRPGGRGDREYNIYGMQPGDVTREIVRAERRLATEWDIK